MSADSRLKILLMGDFSNYHRTLATGLRRLGHSVTVASNGSHWMNTGRDITLRRPLPGPAGGALLWAKLKTLLATGRLTGYDIVELAGVGFVDLRPERVTALFHSLRHANRSVFLSMATLDALYLRDCIDPQFPLRYNEWRVGSHPTPYRTDRTDHFRAWMAPDLLNLADTVYNNVDGVLTGLYEYHLSVCRHVAPDRAAYIGIPVDTAAIPCTGIAPKPDTVRIMLGRHSSRCLEKGTDRLEAAARRVAERHPSKCRLDVVENLPYDKYLERMQQADIVLDQLYSYTPATNALLAMAMGKVAVSGAEPEYYDFIGEQDLHPIVNAVPDDDALTGTIERLVLEPDALRSRGLEGRAFVERHNDVGVVAARALDFWKKRLSLK